MTAYDLIIRNGMIVDGSGGEPFAADVGIRGDRIVEIGTIAGRGAEEIDAKGRIVTPGFIDLHTHYDGQATWENTLQPSSGHGVTTVITGNCSVGFAPCRPSERDILVKLMEGVEDIPEVVMTEGLPWNWETFPDYLDALEQRQFDLNIGTQIPHSPVRVYVMGQRGADREDATADDVARMRAIVAEGIRAGAFGVSLSRFINHRTRAGKSVPSYGAAVEELVGLASGLRDAEGGVIQIIPAMPAEAQDEFDVMKLLVQASGRPLSFSMIPPVWEEYMRLMKEEQPTEAPIRSQIFPRPMGFLFGLDLSFHPFALCPSYRAIENLPLDQKVKAMRDPEVRARLLAETPDDPNPFVLAIVTRPREIYRLGNPPNYVPQAEDGATEAARRLGVSRPELLYDWLLEDEGRAILLQPASNYIDGKLDATAEMMRAPTTLLALGDGGAHYGMICDASYPTFVLSYYARDKHYEDFSVPWAVNAMSRKPAEAIGLDDRGLIAVGMKADINVIDLPNLRLHAPLVVRDLPGGGRRVRQLADGYDATIVNGRVTYRNGVATGVLSGRLLRRGQDTATGETSVERAHAHA